MRAQPVHTLHRLKRVCVKGKLVNATCACRKVKGANASGARHTAEKDVEIGYE